MEYYYLRYVTEDHFMSHTIEDVYTNNLYALSWFYEGPYAFNTYKADRDSYLYFQMFLKQHYCVINSYIM